MIIHSPIISGSLTFANGATFTLPDNGIYSGSFSGSLQVHEVSSHIIPDSNETYDLGSATNRFRDIYLSNSTIKFGGGTIGVNSNGEVILRDYSGNYIPLLSSELKMIDSVSGEVVSLAVESGQLKTSAVDSNGDPLPEPASNLSGSFTGSFVGEVFSNNGVISGSSQVNADSITNFDSNVLDYNNSLGVISGSSQVNADSITNFDSNVLDYNNSLGVISGSSQVQFNDVTNNPFSQDVSSVTVSKSIIPASTTIDLGSSAVPFRDLYLSSASLYIDGNQVISSTTSELIITTDVNQSLKLVETGADTVQIQTQNGDITLTATGTGNIELDAPIQIVAGNKVLSSDGNAIVFGEDLSVEGNITVTGNVDGVDVAALKSSVDAILASSTADKDSFAEIVSLINSVDTTNDQAFAGFVTSSNAAQAVQNGRLDSLESTSGSLLSSLDSHIGNTSNPHSVTKAQVGLGNVDNTSDANKPVSTAQQSALDGKLNINGDGVVSGSSQVSYPSLSNIPSGIVSGSSQVSYPSLSNIPSGIVSGSSQIDVTATTGYSSISSHIGNTSNPHSVTAAQVGLGNVTNESKVTMFTNPTFTGTVTAPTPDNNDNSTKVATTEYVQQELSDLIGGANAAFDTLIEISASLSAGDSNLQGLVDGKLSKASNLSDLTNTSTARTNLGVAIGTDVQAYNSTLAAVAGGTYSGDDSITTIGTVTAGNVNAILPNGTVSGSSQIIGILSSLNTYTGSNDTSISNLNAFSASALTRLTDLEGTDISVTLTGAVTGTGTITNLGDVSISTTATSDPTLTLAGDATGTATFTNLGNATLTVAIVDDSHNHIISNVDGLQSALDGKEEVASATHTLVSGSSQVNVQNTTGYSTISDHINNISNPHSVTKSQVGLGNVDNTSDADKPVSTAQQTALNLKANLASPALTGTPTAPTPADNDNSTKIATTAFVMREVSDLIGGAGAAFDTLLEISASIANGDSDVVALTTVVGGKLQKDQNLSDLTSAATALSNLGLTATATELNYVDGVTSAIQTQLNGKSSTSHNHTLDSLSNTTITSNTSGEILKWNGTAWINNTLAEAGISATGHTHVTADITDLTTAATGITKVGTIGTGVWNGSVIASAYLDADTAHLTGTQTFSGTKTFSAITTISNATASTTTTTGGLVVTGGVGIGGALNVGGDVVAYASSDERLKDNIELISNPIEKVQQLKGVTWEWNDNADELQKSLPNVGVIAQDVEKVLPQLVHDRESGYKGVDYAKLTGLLIEAIKEQQKQIDELKSKLQ